CGRGVEGQRHATAVERDVPEHARDVLLLERHARVTGGRDEPAPVRVGAVNRGLDEGTVRDRLRYSAGLGVGSQTFDDDRDQVLGAFAVGGDEAGQFDADLGHGGVEAVQVVAGQGRPGAVGEEEYGVVRAGMAFDADAVEGLVGSASQNVLQL